MEDPKHQSSQLTYSNEYLDLIRVDSSNQAGSGPGIKQWGIIINQKINLKETRRWQELSNCTRCDITPVIRGKNKGCVGIRLYDMCENPDKDIIKTILDFLTEKDKSRI